MHYWVQVTEEVAEKKEEETARGSGYYNDFY
jgi:hypothetical protein